MADTLYHFIGGARIETDRAETRDPERIESPRALPAGQNLKRLFQSGFRIAGREFDTLVDPSRLPEHHDRLGPAQLDSRQPVHAPLPSRTAPPLPQVGS